MARLNLITLFKDEILEYIVYLAKIICLEMLKQRVIVFNGGWIESHEQELDRWDGLEIPFSKILEFTRNESSMDYNCIGKNCKHF